ncbi:short-chain dehydrogenase/reductase SDR [Gonapodya prolifera JEL478]|uniref:Short-chain dehydrogenase/reductase SDR n=1 Tax=Gonapodya prolifera (strain JEL478) TaxID=1344416 RepID=A0A139AA23_GONPJ|nr:short-chain dehydrogenase/reductase SDR [Gonapodya prolifera JEL478]|eukprot:KXS13345.1 short-chain dehydrogenase/reductase SDR [Gonapodya prolifera JEL478]
MSSSSIVVVAGFGPGISNSVAKKWGRLGFKVALVSRTKSRVDEGAAALAQDGIDAKGFAADLTDPNAVKQVLADAKKAFDGAKVKILHWNAYGQGAGLLDHKIADLLVQNFAISVSNILVAVHAVLPDLEATKGAVLVTGGAFGLEHDDAVKAALAFNAATLAISKAAQRKTVFLLNATLASKGIYAGEVTVAGQVKGTAWDDGKGTATIDPDDVANKFAELEEKRDVVNVIFS